MAGMGNNRMLWLVAVALMAAVWGVYGRCAGFDFVMYDDGKYVTGNAIVKSGLGPAAVRWALTTTLDANWFPLTWLSHLLTVQFFGLRPGAHHLVNVFLHGIDTVLLLVLLHRMTGALWRSVLVAALFALHPLHVESVAWVAERKDVLSALFWLLTMLAWCRYAERPGVGRYVGTLVLFGCGLMAKPMLVTLPFVLLLVDYWPLGRLSRQTLGDGSLPSFPSVSPARLVLEKVPFLLLAAASSVVTFIVQRKGGAVNVLDNESLLFNVANGLVSYVRYVGKMFWPRDLAVFYPLPAALPTWQAASAAALLLLLTLLVLWQARRRPYVAVGWFWYLGTLVPVIGFVRVGAHAIADRYTYLPLIGLFIILAWGGAELAGLRSWGPKSFAAVAAALVTALAVVSWYQVGTWRNNYTLFEHALAATQGNWLAHNNLATALVADGRFDEALYHVNEALRFKPDYAAAYNNLGVISNKLGDPVRTIAAYNKALSLDPTLAETRFNLGLVYLGKGERDKALEEYRALARFNPEQAGALLKFIDFADRMR
ncbi:MAG TPA: tetratricopeptide repeat protein [Geobacteraceae bacterium]